MIKTDEYIGNPDFEKEDMTCLDFACSVWEKHTGKSWNSSPLALRGLERVDEPANPCVVLMKREGFPPHVGIFVDGKILHKDKAVVAWVPLDFIKYSYRELHYYV